MPIVVTSRERTQALFMLVLATAFWGLSFPLIKGLTLAHERLLPGSSNWFVTSWALAPRFLISTAILFFWQIKNLRNVSAAEWKQGLFLGGFAAVGMLFQTDGLKFTTASTSAFLTQFYAILIPIFLALKARRGPPWTVWVSSTLVLMGVGVLGHFDVRTMHFGRGELETLICSVFFMGQILCLEVRAFSLNRVLPVTLIMFAAQTAFFSAIAFATAAQPQDLLVTLHSGPWLVMTLFVAVLSTFAALLLMNTFQPKITATEAGLVYCAEPIFGSMLALFLPALISHWAEVNYTNETATQSLMIGGGMITIANILIQLKPLPKQ